MVVSRTSVFVKQVIAASLLVVAVLLVSNSVYSISSTAFSEIGHTHDKLPAAQSITLPGSYYIPIEVVTSSNSTWLSYSVQSNLTISTALMDSSQFNEFNNSQTDDISNSITYQNGTTAQADLQVSIGDYYLVFYNLQTQTANISFSYLTYPFTPYFYGPVTPPQPTGLASFGLYNVSGNAVPYSIETSSIVGVSNISSIQAYNASAPSLNDTVSGATLQLNAMLVAEGLNGTNQQVYWAQNTPDFVSNASQISYNDNIWNYTTITGNLSNATMTSPNGNSVFSTGDNVTESEYYYAYGTNNYTYVEPFDFELLLNESVLSGKGILLQIGTQVLRNGSAPTPGPTPPVWFDNITISDPGVQSAYFYVNGNDSTPIGTYYDAELVFCGEGNLEETNFTQMNATLGLYYLNETSGQFSSFPSYYSFGGDTGEAADNLHVNYLGNGTAQVDVGTPNYVYLGEVSNATTVTTTASSSAYSSSMSSVSSSQISSSTTSSPSSTNSGASEISDGYFIALIPAAAVIILGGASISRRRRTVIK